MRYRKGYYKKDGTYVQGHFVNRPSRKKKRGKTGCMLLLSLGLTTLLVAACSSSEDTDETNISGCAQKNCSDFSSQAEAQAAFDNNPNCYKNLDRDKDQKACETGDD
jgi:hypothetical protein